MKIFAQNPNKMVYSQSFANIPEAKNVFQTRLTEILYRKRCESKIHLSLYIYLYDTLCYSSRSIQTYQRCFESVGCSKLNGDLRDISSFYKQINNNFLLFHYLKFILLIKVNCGKLALSKRRHFTKIDSNAIRNLSLSLRP